MRSTRAGIASLVALTIALVGCGPVTDPAAAGGDGDPHSFSRPDEVRVEHARLQLTVDFEERRIQGRASLTIDNPGGATELWLDTRDLEIRRVELDDPTMTAEYRLGNEVEHLGRSLTIEITPDTRTVHIDYATSPAAIAVQWLDPEQTAGGRHPFLLTQSQSVFARTWVPCQDTPSTRMTYEARVEVPPGLMALMSASNPTEKNREGSYEFRMPQPIPTYLLALAVGDLEFRELGPRSGIYAEPETLAAAAWEFAETEQMIAVAESLFGPYDWERFDILVLPPSFPYGGMENPRLTFVTPTLLAGDRSLVATIAHELAHSWTGNLVTNATWQDMWLNEGFTSYGERRIIEEIYGREAAELQSALDLRKLIAEFEELEPDHDETRLHVDLRGRDPEGSFTSAAYDKGYLLVRLLEETFGRQEWDAFLQSHFRAFAFQSIDSPTFLATLRRELIEGRPDAAELEARLRLDEWVYEPGLPDNHPVIESEHLALVERELAAWANGKSASELGADAWTTNQRLHFIRELPDALDTDRLAELDRAMRLTGNGNAEIHMAWLEAAIASGYEPADAALAEFLTRVGRLKFLDPLYSALAETPEGRARALEIYAEARPGYHPLAQHSIDGVLESE